MKYFFLFLTLATMLGCNKDNSDFHYWGHAFAKFNGTGWKAKTRTFVNKPYEQGIDIKLSRLNKQGYNLDGLFLFKIPWVVGKHKLSLTDVRDVDSLSGAFFSTLIDGDILGDTYQLAEGDIENYIEVTKIEGDKIWVEFQLTLAIERYGQEPKYPDTIRITEGRANGKLE